MARPQKEGLDYFPLDVDIDQDDKVALVEAQHGVTGFAVVVKLLMKIYKNSYFYSWTEKEQLLFSRSINVDINALQEVVNDCIKWDLFSKKMYDDHRILTSKGIQLRYLEAVSRRQEVKISKEYLMICKPKVNEYKNLVIEGVNVDINPIKEAVNDYINPQSKVKESKVNKIKEKKSKEKDKTLSPKQVYDEQSVPYQLASRLFQNILSNNPDHKTPNLKSWANDVRLMMERDNRTEEQIIYLMDWCQNDSFWKSNILSVSKLREKFDQLVIRVKEDIQKQNKATKQEVPKAYQSLQDWADEE